MCVCFVLRTANIIPLVSAVIDALLVTMVTRRGDPQMTASLAPVHSQKHQISELYLRLVLELNHQWRSCSEFSVNIFFSYRFIMGMCPQLLLCKVILLTYIFRVRHYHGINGTKSFAVPKEMSISYRW